MVARAVYGVEVSAYVLHTILPRTEAPPHQSTVDYIP